MAILRALLIVFEVLVSLLLIGLILLQKSREQGLGLAFGANVGESLFGSRAGNVLTKGTVILGSIFAANTLVLGLLYAGGAQSDAERRLEESPAPIEAPAPASPAPFGAPAEGLSPNTGAAAAPGVVDLRTVTSPAAPAEAVPAPDTPEPSVPEPVPPEPGPDARPAPAE